MLTNGTSPSAMSSSKVIFVTGGARSGKSDYAQRRTEALAGAEGNLVYVATAAILDEEMGERVEAHRRVRGSRWSTVEELIDLAAAIGGIPAGSSVLVDCLTLWSSNLMHEYGGDGEALEARVAEFLRVVEETRCNLVIVTNEVGMGIVPENKLARQFRDVAGKINQRVSALADEAYLIVSGRALKLE